MKSSLTILALALCLASLLGAAIAQRPAQQTIQAALDKLPASDGTIHALALQGGEVKLTLGSYDLGTAPLTVWGSNRFCGSGSRIVYHGKGAAIRFGTKNLAHGQHQGGTVCCLAIHSDADGIGLATSNETKGITIENVVLDCVGTALALDNGQTVYGPRITNVHVHSAGTQALKLRGRVISIDGFFCVNNTRDTGKLPLVEIIGDGHGNQIWLESSWPGYFFVHRDGQFSVTEMWSEPHRDGPSVGLFNSTFIMDTTSKLFAKPKQPIDLTNSSLVPQVLGFTDDGGGKPTDAAGIAALAKRCFQCDSTSRVVNFGKIVVGAGM